MTQLEQLWEQIKNDPDTYTKRQIHNAVLGDLGQGQMDNWVDYWARKHQAELEEEYGPESEVEEFVSTRQGAGRYGVPSSEVFKAAGGDRALLRRMFEGGTLRWAEEPDGVRSGGTDQKHSSTPDEHLTEGRIRTSYPWERYVPPHRYR